MKICTLVAARLLSIQKIAFCMLDFVLKRKSAFQIGSKKEFSAINYKSLQELNYSIGNRTDFYNVISLQLNAVLPALPKLPS